MIPSRVAFVFLVQGRVAIKKENRTANIGKTQATSAVDQTQLTIAQKHAASAPVEVVATAQCAADRRHSKVVWLTVKTQCPVLIRGWLHFNITEHISVVQR